MPLVAFSRTVADIFAAAVDDRQTPRALEAVAKFAGVSGVGCVMRNKFTGPISSAAWWGSLTGRPADYMSHYGKIDPSRAIWDDAATCGRLLRVSECLPQSLLSNDEWYNDWLLKGGIRDILGTTLYESSSRKMSIGLYRAIGDVGPFPRAEAQLQVLLPSLRDAARLNVGLIDAGYRSALGRGSIDLLATGAIFTDRDGRIIDANRAGEQILIAGDGLTMRNGQVISARRSFETAKLARLIANAAAAEGSVPSAGSMLITRDHGRPPYVVRVAPASGGLTGDDLPMAMLVISTPEERLVSQGELSELYGLSPVESRIALALARGKRLTELAGEFGVQITTLRSQLSSILTKCEVERQSDLVRLISTIPVVHPVRPETAP
jgi:DNA-binding CsgD family transcriptional regulator/PAS domain-containing protein